LLDGQVPSTAAQAQLLNAACQVAYGPDPQGSPLPRLWSPSPAVREWLVLLLGGGRGGDGYRAGGGYHHDYGGGARTPALNHNISRDDYNRATNGGRDRFDANRLGWGNRNWNEGDWRGNNWRGDQWGYNNWDNRWNGGWNNNWNNGGFWGDRPWSYGWYNWSPDTWGWWGGNAEAWGLAGLAAGDVITDLVNDASDQQSPVIEVPDSNYQLNYGTVDAVGNSGANFSYSVAVPTSAIQWPAARRCRVGPTVKRGCSTARCPPRPPRLSC